VTSHRIPVDAYVWTTRGPCRAGDLELGAQLTIINTHGRFATSTIASISQAADRKVVRLRTTAGEIHLEASAVVTTRGARVFASAAAAEVLVGREIRIELAHPFDGSATAFAEGLPAATRAALSLLEVPVVRVPRRLGMDDELTAMLKAAAVAYEDHSDDRWTALCFERPAATFTAGPVGAADAVAIQAITAWARTDAGVTESRTTVDQRSLRARLVSALAAGGNPASVTWTPGYGPVEARVRPGAGFPYAKTRGADQIVMPCVDIAIEHLGSAITDLAIVASRREQAGLDR
jgi:hypothetical protein